MHSVSTRSCFAVNASFATFVLLSCLGAAFRIPIGNISLLITVIAVGVFCFFFLPQPVHEIRRLLLAAVGFASVILLVLFLTTNYLSRGFICYVSDGFSYC
ncbi:MAG: hypothetical protein JO308_04835 [Verrucomicrobia bacterium]|nr:hypothetical protein [Verrucomicrobiota bacterium]